VGIPCDLKPRCMYSRFLALCACINTPDFGRFMACATGLLRKTCRARQNLPHTSRSRSKRVCDGRVLTPVKDGVLEHRIAQGDGLRRSPETWELSLVSGNPASPPNPFRREPCVRETSQDSGSVGWPEENIAAYIELLIEEINEKTEFDLRAQPWRH
jgi:hypothetical protein